MTDDPAILNPVVPRAKVIFTEDGRTKVGDGRRHYNDLPFTVGTPGPAGPAGETIVMPPVMGPAGPQGPTGADGSVATLNASNLTSGIIPDARFNTAGLPVVVLANKASDAAAIHPVTLYAKGVTVKTSGSPADIATIAVPAGISRWHLISSTANAALAETASGTLAAASFTAWTAAGGTGTQLTPAFAGPTSATALVSIAANSLSVFTTSATIVIRQTANSANPGTMSFYFTLYPII